MTALDLSFLRPVRLLAILSALSATLPAAALPKTADSKPEHVQGSTKQAKRVVKVKDLKRLVQLLERIERAWDSFISPAQVIGRLRQRTPSYRTYKTATKKPADTGTPEAKTVTGDTPATQAPPKTPLISDAAKKTLPAGTVFTVEDMPVSEKEVRDLANYFASYQTGKDIDHLRSAVLELIQVATVQAQYKDKLAELKKKIDGYHKVASAAGADFGSVARKHSQCPSSAQGGNLGSFGRVGMVPSFARQAFGTGVGKLSPVFPSSFGYHFIKVTGMEKGDSPAKSMVTASHVLVMYSNDQSELRELAQKASSGRSEVAAIDDKWRNRLPSSYR